MKDDLKEFRERLDHTDRAIIKALADRQQIVKQISELKRDHSGRIRDLQREESVLNKIRNIAKELNLDPSYAEDLYREIITNSVRYQALSLIDQDNERAGSEKVRVSFQGGEGAFSHAAALRHFGDRFDQVEPIGFNTFQQAADALITKKVDYAILPIENTTAGSINDTYDILGSDEVHIVGEEILRIVHCLMALEEIPLKNVRRVLSHPQALAQCTHFLSTMPDCEVVSYLDTALSAKKVAEDGDLSKASIAGAQAADIYGLKVIASDIANQKGNYTRFVVASRKPVKVDSQVPAKTSLLMVTSHEEGALLKCLNILHTHKVNLAKLESRPRLNEPWHYSFYVDLEGNVEDPEISSALDELNKECHELKVLGCYPKQ
ncbi:prephenate dehydratase [Balneola sp. MJW-20]|uniref:prephenate dehydratase n=1 Tax=Gracilimonas aurantiaca TaxID=3234185 RepID=UPI0034663DE0